MPASDYEECGGSIPLVVLSTRRKTSCTHINRQMGFYTLVKFRFKRSTFPLFPLSPSFRRFFFLILFNVNSYIRTCKICANELSLSRGSVARKSNFLLRLCWLFTWNNNFQIGITGSTALRQIRLACSIVWWADSGCFARMIHGWMTFTAHQNIGALSSSPCRTFLSLRWGIYTNHLKVYLSALRKGDVH